MSGGGGSLFEDDLIFPSSVWSDASAFDTLVQGMASAVTKAAKRINKDGSLHKLAIAQGIRPVLDGHGVGGEEDRRLLTETFETWVGLERSHRDQIWGYYVRNMVRPIWLAQASNRVDVLVGNPPWLRYSKMPESMQERYKALSKPRQLLTGGLGASARDLSTLFVVRAIDLYLREGGVFGFVMPFGVLSRRPHTGFRSAKWHSDQEGGLAVAFEQPWDLSDVKGIFPMTSCVIRGIQADDPLQMPGLAAHWTSPKRGRAAQIVGQTDIAAINAGDRAELPYERAFRDGAILYPRVLLLVNQITTGPLGLGGGRIEVESARSPLEKAPWKSVGGLQGVVERKFIVGLHLGETVAPFRALPARDSVLPVDDIHILNEAEIAVQPALSDWWDGVEDAWRAHRSKAETKPLLERMNYHNQLSAQLPIRSNRVVYTKSGKTLFAARIPDTDRSIIDHKLFWGSFDTVDEALYLVGLLNSKALLGAVARYQAKGLYGARDFDKYVFRVGMVQFDAVDPGHLAIVEAARQCEARANSVVIPDKVNYSGARKLVEAALDSCGARSRLEEAVSDVLFRR